MLQRKMVAVLSAESEFDLLFVHRDADAAGHEARTIEIGDATNGAGLAVHHVPIVPVRTTEAWVLLDEAAIRRVAGNPRGREPLNLPRPARVEDLHAPKDTLESALTAASGFRGSRLRKFRRRFGRQRQILLAQLPVGGALEQVPAWRRLKDSVSRLVARNEDS